jgi:hypothetical protein
MPQPSFYVESEGPDPRGVQLGLLWLQRTCTTQKATTAWIVAHGKDNLRGNLAPHITQAGEDALLKGNAVPFGPTRVHLQVVTERGLGYSGPGGPVLAIYTSPKLLTKLDNMSDISALAVVPWLRDEITPWITKWQAQEVQSGGGSTSPQRQLSPVVEAALSTLTDSVNLSTGLSHPNDRSKAIWLFRILRDGGEAIDFGALPSWLVNHSWRSSDADEVAQVARDIYNGKRLRAGERPWRETILQLWRTEAKSEKTT